MALSHPVVKELTNELATLRQRRHEIDLAVQGIELLIADAARESTTAMPALRGNGRGSRAPARARAKRGSLRSRLIAVLSESEGLRGIEVAEHLTSQQFKIGGRAGLRERISHELSRLRRLGVLKKNELGQYTLAERAVEPQVPQEATEMVAANGELRSDSAMTVVHQGNARER